MGKLTDRKAGPAPRLMLLSVFGLMLAAPAHAQSATNFNTKPLAPKAASAKKDKEKDKAAGKAPVSKEPAPASTTPSRYIGEAELDAFVQSMAATFSMRERATDPFGQYQDPDAKPVIKTTVAKTTRKVQTFTATPFSEIIRYLKVTTIMPGEKRFLLADRSFKQGERMPLIFRGKNISAEITYVGARQIDFRNVESGETASLKMELLPPGMSFGTKGITAPGMVPANHNTPIELEPSGSNSDTTPQNL
jgi:hypothetical protein